MKQHLMLTFLKRILLLLICLIALELVWNLIFHQTLLYKQVLASFFLKNIIIAAGISLVFYLQERVHIEK